MGRETNKSRRAAQAQSARDKAAAARLAQRRDDQRRRAIIVISSVVAVAVIGAVIALVAINSNSKSKAGPATAASSSVLQNISNVPASTIDAVGKGGSFEGLKAINDTTTGKPNFLFIGGEFCPYCAGERWAIIQSLSRFGTFSGLQQIRSSEDNFPTFDFLHASYTSKYLTFTAREVSDQNHQQLQKLNSAEQATFVKYSPSGTFPFIYIAGKYYQVGAGLNVGVLSGLDQAQVAADLKDPSSDVAKAIIGEANVLTAAICKATGDQPSSVCTSTITGLQSQLGT